MRSMIFRQKKYSLLPECTYIQWMSEYGTTKIQSMLKSEFRQVGFQTFGPLELHPNCLKSKLTTSTIKQHLNAIINALQVDRGLGCKKSHLNVVLCFVIVPFYFSVWNPNSEFCLNFLEFGFQTEKSVWNPNCLETGRNWTVWNPN